MNSTQLQNNFENSKNQCLGKRDKSSAGRIDPHAVQICAVLNQRREYYTTSSCAGRCLLYQGPGIKSTLQFKRFRVSHDKIHDAQRYFDLSTLEEDPSGGGDPVPAIGQYDYKEQGEDQEPKEQVSTEVTTEGKSIWLRFEPFILHVACRSLAAASALMAAARPAFKVSFGPCMFRAQSTIGN